VNATAEYVAPNRDGDFADWDDPGMKTYKLFAGVKATWPILDGGKTDARAGQLEADRNALLANRDDAMLIVRRDVEGALSDLRVALAVWRSDSDRVTTAQEALRLAQAGYKGGTLPASDVRDAEASLADARAEEAQSSMDYWIARASLDHATGAATKES
jgi:outer membrane protein TolC